MRIRRTRLVGGAAAAALAGASLVTFGSSLAHGQQAPGPSASGVTITGAKATTPIKHLVVIFDENVSFDHYFGTYPKAANTDGPSFHAVRGTPMPDNLISAHLLKKNPNQYAPRRLKHSQALTCDQNHAYQPEQMATNSGKMNKFVQYVSADTCTGNPYGAPGLTMNYFDGNTVTAMWNYAQNFALSDRFFGSAYGPSTPGAIELVSGNTHGFIEVDSKTLKPVPPPADPYAVVSPNAKGVGTMINDPDPAFDDCSDSNHTSTNTLAMAAPGQKNIGDLLNAQGVTWGWFQGGFAPTKAATSSSYAVCGAHHKNVGGNDVVDYSPHHDPFEYYKSTSNPHHLPPSSVTKIGQTDQANHNYDLTDFHAALKAGVMPQVSFLKAPSYEDGHAGYSDPIDEQHFLVKQVNAIQKSKFWKNTAIVIAYDDSDGWYDHVFAKITNGSSDADNDAAVCLKSGVPARGGQQDRCGPGPRLPLLVISPYAKANAIDHHQIEQASITKFIEQNWSLGRIGRHSFDTRAGSMKHLFDFSAPDPRTLILRPNGTVKHSS